MHVHSEFVHGWHSGYLYLLVLTVAVDHLQEECPGMVIRRTPNSTHLRFTKQIYIYMDM